MKAKLLILLSTLVGLLLSGCSTTCNCGKTFVKMGHTISFQELSNMPPFTATFGSVDFDHPFFLSKTSVNLWLQKSDGTGCLVVDSYPANKTILGFVRSLEGGHEYVFPQVYLDYVNRQETNAAPAGPFAK